jgi:predicted DNA repair protein MutK
MLGGAFLCFEGVEKLAHRWLHSKAEDAEHHRELVEAVADPSVDMVEHEKHKVKGAIRTDFILSAEIVVISLGTLEAASFGNRVAVLCVVAVGMTVGVYGLVAGIVKLDDLGLRLIAKTSAFAKAIGRAILRGAPLLMKGLSIAGTAAMFLVGGGIITHGVHVLQAWSDEASALSAGVPGIGWVVGEIVAMLIDAGIGVLVGIVILLVVTGVKKVLPQKPPTPGSA